MFVEIGMYSSSLRDVRSDIQWTHDFGYQATRLAAWGGQDATLLIRRQGGSRGPLAEASERETLSLPHSRPLPVIGPRCHELRMNDANTAWRIVVRIDPDAILILEVFSKKTQTTPTSVIEACRRRLSVYDQTN